MSNEGLGDSHGLRAAMLGRMDSVQVFFQVPALPAGVSFESGAYAPGIFLQCPAWQRSPSDHQIEPQLENRVVFTVEVGLRLEEANRFHAVLAQTVANSMWLLVGAQLKEQVRAGGSTAEIDRPLFISASLPNLS